MSDTSPHRLSVELNEAFSSNKCQLVCIRRAAACLEEGLASPKLVTQHAKMESMLQLARNVVHMAREFMDAVYDLRRDLDEMDDTDDDEDDTDDDETNNSDK
jgi:hypothetical protein